MDHKKLVNIGIIPTIKETYKNQYEFSIDIKIFNFLKKIFKKYKSHIIIENNDIKNIDLVIFCGGNDLKIFNKSKRNKIRHKIDIKILKVCLKNKIKILGICYGSQVIANYFNSKLVRKKNHIRFHTIKFLNGYKTKKKVNSFHNYAISKLGDQLTPIAIANDMTYEAYIHKKKNILGLMWHPERYRNIQKIDIKLIKNYLCN